MRGVGAQVRGFTPYRGEKAPTRVVAESSLVAEGIAEWCASFVSGGDAREPWYDRCSCVASARLRRASFRSCAAVCFCSGPM